MMRAIVIVIVDLLGLLCVHLRMHSARKPARPTADLALIDLSKQQPQDTLFVFPV